MCKFAVGLAASALLLVSLRALSQTTRQIDIDVSKVTGPHSPTPLMTIGAGRANEGLRADWQQQLATIQSDIGFHYIRFHGLLHDDMGVYTEDEHGAPSYNFQYVDALYDALLAHHIRPFVELSFMPAKLASGTKTVFWWKGNVTPPKDMDKWNGLIRALMTHWRERYGEQEISTWYYEVWNEPNLPNFWGGTQQQYFDLYASTAKDIRDICQHCRVGGPATAGGKAWVSEWLDFTAKNHVPADFVSTHTYSVNKVLFDATGKTGTALNPSPDSVIRTVSQTRGLIEHSATPGLPLHYTEWSTSSTPTDPIHDQYISAAFILDKLRNTSAVAQSMSYWTFTDIFEENGPRFTPFHGGFGLLNYQGIRKPSFFAYKFLAQLGPEDVASSDPQSWSARSADGSVQVLFWDYVGIAPPSGQDDQHFYKLEQPANTAPTASLHLHGLRDGRYRLQVFRTGFRQNDAYTAYVRMGSPSQLTRAQVEALNTEASGAPVESKTIKIKGGQYIEQFQMHENDTVLFILKPE